MQSESMASPFQGNALINSVYFIECSHEDEPYIRHSRAPLAIRPLIDATTHNATWETNSSRSEYISWDKVEGIEGSQSKQTHRPLEQEVTVIDKGPEKIVLSKQNHSLRLVKLTLKIFNEKIRPHVAGGKTLNFASDQDLQNFFLSSSFEK